VPDQRPIALIKAAWKIVSQELVGMDKIPAQDPPFFDGLFNENVRLGKELELLKALGTGNPNVPPTHSMRWWSWTVTGAERFCTP
jgi:hypothetical protein